jgi:lysophospholipase L1-like esterase
MIRKLKNIILNFVLSISSLIIILLLLEVAVRIFIPITKPQMIVKRGSDKTVPKKLNYGDPFFEGIFQSAEYTTRIITNSEGFRDVEHRLKKDKGVFRILAVGDSFTFGLGVEANQTYPKILEAMLNKNTLGKKHFEVFNMGIAGIGTLEELEIIEYGLRYKPDLILLGVFVENRWNPGNGNDLCDNLKSRDRLKNSRLVNQNENIITRPIIRPVDALNSLQRFLATNSDLYFLIMTRLGTNLRKSLIGLRQNQNQSELALSWDITEKAIKKIKRLADKEGVAFVIVRIPFLYDVYSPKNDEAKNILTVFSNENNINMCDLSDVMGNNKNSDLYYPADGHWKSLAHKLAAGDIFAYLNDHKLLDNKNFSED